MPRLALNALALVCSLGFLCGARTDEAVKADRTSWYFHTTHLLDHLANNSRFTQEDQEFLHAKASEIDLLAATLLREEGKLRVLRREREESKRGKALWRFHRDTREAVDEARLKVGKQARRIEDVAEDIMIHWRQIKPVFGIFSQMFFAELFVSALFVVHYLLDFFFYMITFELIAMLFFGPIMLWLWFWFFSTGLVFMPFLIYGLEILWICSLPRMMLEYDPSLAQFMAVYSLVVSGVIAVNHVGALLANAVRSLLFGKQKRE